MVGASKDYGKLQRKQTSHVNELALSMYGKRQESGLTEIAPLMCTSLSGARSLLFSMLSPFGVHGVCVG